MCSEMIQLFSERDDSVAIKFVVLCLTKVYEQQQLARSRGKNDTQLCQKATGVVKFAMGVVSPPQERLSIPQERLSIPQERLSIPASAKIREVYHRGRELAVYPVIFSPYTITVR